MNQETSSDENLKLMSFSSGGQDFCLDIAAVREVRGWTPATPLPHAPEHMRGVINLRGTVLPIIDLKSALGLGTTQIGSRSVIIVVQMGHQVAGLLVDAVSEILAAPRASVQPPPDVGCDTVNRFVHGIIAQGDRMVSWISLDAALH